MKAASVGAKLALSYTHLIKIHMRPPMKNKIHTFSKPPQPERCHGIPTIGYGTNVEAKLNVPDIDVAHQLPVLSTLLIIASEPQTSTVVDAFCKKPYEVIAVSDSEAVDVVDANAQWLRVLRSCVETTKYHEKGAQYSGLTNTPSITSLSM